MKIIDTTTFFEEHLMMDLRFNILDPFVDKFVVCEARFSHSGKEKEIKFNKKDYPKFEEKIIHLIIDDDPIEKNLSKEANPSVLIDVDHSMNFMMEETFGPTVGIMKVKNEDEAAKLMNDSPYGLTACIWTSDKEFAERFGPRINTGTFFMNRCDYLDPGLAWTGVKNTGTGVTLSVLGFDHVTRAKSYHYRTI